MGSEDLKLVSIYARGRFRRVGETHPGIAAAWGKAVELAIGRGADRFVIESESADAASYPISNSADHLPELVQRGLESRAMNLFAGHIWICSISDEGTAIAASLPSGPRDALRATAEAEGLAWDEFDAEG